MRAAARRSGVFLAPALVLGLLAPAARADRLVPRPTSQSAWVARVVAPAIVKDKPWGKKVLMRVKTRAPWGGGPVSLLVLDSIEVVDGGAPGSKRLWLRVALPVRPNETSGWIPADYTQVTETRWRITISTSTRKVRVLHDGKLERSFRAVVGAPSTPTPKGLFAVNEEIRQADPKGFVGPVALHLTAFSNVLDDYGGGPGRVAIHGRGGASLRDPLGTARSHGCTRVDSDDVEYLTRAVPLGTPVRIT